MTLKEKQKQEALKRMGMLKMMKNVIKDFEKNDRVYYSERQNRIFNAVLYWLDNESNYVEIVKKFEEENDALVYHCQLTHLEFGDCLSLLFVSKYEEDWEYERNLINEGLSLAYVENLDDELFSEMDTIGIAPSMGGVLRTA